MTTDGKDAAPPAAGLGRRGLLTGIVGLGVAAGVGLGPKVAAAAVRPERRLKLRNVHTGDSFDGVYWRGGVYDRSALYRLNVVLRDTHTHRVARIDPKILDVLSQIHRVLHSRQPFEVHCGYRSPETNELLIRAGMGAAQESFHLKGMAMDISLPDRGWIWIGRAALAQKAGGVGLYPKSGFVHVDVGPVRHWGSVLRG